MPSTSDSVKVAVRVRPFNQREKNAGSSCILSMKDKTTTITNPENGDTKMFAYDHSYWSHDSFRETQSGIYEADSPGGPYVDQRHVFSDLGQGVLDNAWQGYNAALFAYGQTGSGKSYSMIGYGPNKGIVPITCEELFNAIEENKDDKKQLRVSFSMLEIYNEQVRDLLVKTKPPHGGLKVRQNPKTGFYVEGLKQVPVRNYKEIEKLMESGTINRTTASTNMNATSSRSHMVITIKFEQVFISETGQSNTRSSDINLVDLAGSERADSTGATGDRLKEGSAINQSLSTLGNVISALADQAMGKKKVMVPYRDSVLTKLLQSALGGNSRTIMIAALSPADINYEETLSTLRYADRAKKIQNKATINESPTDRLIRELKEENARLLAMLKKQSGGDTSEFTDDDIQRMLEINQKRMGDMQMSWEQRLEEARKEWERAQHLEYEETPKEWKAHPYITNVNEDPQLSGVIRHAFCTAKTVIGRSGSKNVTAEIRGLGIQPVHAEVYCDGRSTFIKPSSDSAVVLINGTKVREKTALHHLDRLKLGSTSVFLYIGFTHERKDEQETAKYDFDFCMTELAEHEGVSMDIHTPRELREPHDLSNMVLFQDFVDLMPKIAEANAVSDEMKRNVKFEPIVKSDASHDPSGKSTGKEVIVKVTNTVSRKVWVWTKMKFLNRKDLIDEVYIKFLDGDNVILTRDKDPFWDPVEDIFLGSAHIMLQSISYCAETDEHFTIHNYHGKEEAVVHVKMLPCNDKGKVIAEDDMILEPKDLLGKSLNFLFTLTDCMGVRWISEENSRGVQCRFTFHCHKPSKTKDMWHKSYIDFDYKQVVTYKPVTKNLLDYFQKNSLVLELWGKQISEDEELHKTNGKILHQSHKKKSVSYKIKDIKDNRPNTYKDHTADVLSQLKTKEDELEQTQAERDELKKENFKLRQSLMRTEQKMKLMEIRKERKQSTERRPSNERKPGLERKPSLEKRASVDDFTKPAQGALDVEFAKSLREFFREARDIQNGMRDMRDYVSSTKNSVNGNGLRKSFENHEQKLKSTDEKLSECLNLLKKSAAAALRKGRPTTE